MVGEDSEFIDYAATYTSLTLRRWALYVSLS